MKISVIIPVLNEQERIVLAIERAWKSGADEVIVVDGGSTDQTVDLAGELNCRVLSADSGRATQMNCGAKHAAGDFLLFLHVDNWLVEGGCHQIRDLGESADRSFGGFRQTIESKGVVFRWIETGNELRAKWQGLVYGDQAFFIRREMFDRCGGFPEIELMEDFALSKRLRQIGRPVVLPGPTYVSPRRWQKYGPLRQTVQNWFLAGAYRLGASPAWLARRYRRHDK